MEGSQRVTSSAVIGTSCAVLRCDKPLSAGLQTLMLKGREPFSQGCNYLRVTLQGKYCNDGNFKTGPLQSSS